MLLSGGQTPCCLSVPTLAKFASVLTSKQTFDWCFLTHWSRLDSNLPWRCLQSICYKQKYNTGEEKEEKKVHLTKMRRGKITHTSNWEKGLCQWRLHSRASSWEVRAANLHDWTSWLEHERVRVGCRLCLYEHTPSLPCFPFHLFRILLLTTSSHSEIQGSGKKIRSRKICCPICKPCFIKSRFCHNILNIKKFKDEDKVHV